MNIELKRASSKDLKPTINMSDLKGKADYGTHFYLSLSIHGEPYTTTFHKSRDETTLYADEWDTRLPLPAIGNSLDVYLIDITRKGTIHDDIRLWAAVRGIYQRGDTKTQIIKLMEEVGELSKAILNKDKEEIIDGIGDCIVVLTNLAKLESLKVEDCIESAYQVISKRKGHMENGTFKKNGV